MSLSGDIVNGKNATFAPTSITSWVRNAIYSITKIVKEYNLDAIDIDYEHFNADPDTFAECIKRLLYYLKQNNVVCYTSIAPYADDSVQVHYLALWRKYGHLIDYVKFQFYAYEKGTTIPQLLQYFETQSCNFKGGKILVSFGTNNIGGLSPKNGFFDACTTLKREGKLHDYTNTKSPEPTNGNFLVYWDTDNLTPSHISSIKAKYKNVKVGMSLGGDTVNGKNATFAPTSITSWVRNAIYSITKITEEYNLDAIDIDYEHFNADPDTFSECIGRLLYYLKQNNVVTYTSIAPYADDSVQVHYLALWRKYGHLIDYVNFQFYAYENGITIPQFLQYFETQMYNYKGGKILVSFGSDNSGGLSPKHGFFYACTILRSQGNLHGIFIWSADDSTKDRFVYEELSQDLLASAV
ncbi:hypothetical protein K7X08_028253 [Anisodus acutangulus]|uniref:GH18 domain-containing protein n=1 Tax=Anisodus acutangulus TaxID=402998 RepID=A0A9Q1M648_9SOLA|nr:hypothetical protein K7X08_028253 [Anisodus acutangulus]